MTLLRTNTVINIHLRGGMGQKLTSFVARVAAAAINPECLPISLTSPIPLGTAIASVCAHLIALQASSTAVSNPKVFETSQMSLSMVLGTATTAILSPLLLISSFIF